MSSDESDVQPFVDIPKQTNPNFDTIVSKTENGWVVEKKEPEVEVEETTVPRVMHPTLCKYFCSSAGCRDGAQCTFRHEKICRSYQKHHRCYRGRRCMFLHELPVHPCDNTTCGKKTRYILCKQCFVKKHLRPCKNPTCTNESTRAYCKPCFIKVLCKVCTEIPCACEKRGPPVLTRNVFDILNEDKAKTWVDL